MSYKKYQCEHGREKYRCKDCGGIGICEHNRRKSQCRDCGGSQICEHKRKKSTCRECGNVIKKTIDRFIRDSKAADKRYNRLDIVNFIDRDFCKLLIEESNDKCCYCECNLEYVLKCHNLISIERINNDIGHIKSNVKISCYHCNLLRVGSQVAKL